MTTSATSLGISLDWGMFHPTIQIGADEAAQQKFLSRVAELRASGLEHVRFELPMREMLEIATDAHHPSFAIIDALLALDLRLILVVGIGNKRALPDDLKVSDPRYIERVSQSVYDTVVAMSARYPNDKPRIEYQIENELNAAGLQTTYPFAWREGARWWDTRFKVSLLSSLHAAVKRADPQAIAHSNFMDQGCDPVEYDADGSLREATGGTYSLRGLARLADAFLHKDENVEKAARLLGPYIDEGQRGFDFYSNYAVPKWATDAVKLLRPSSLEERAKFYARIFGEPVHLREIGIPARSPLGHSADDQANYYRALEAEIPGSGVLSATFFRMADPVLPPRRALDVGPNDTLEPYFGLLDSALEPKPAWHALIAMLRAFA